MSERDTDVRIGRFVIRKRLGRGGMGAVYEGYDPSLDRRVAIKTLTTEAISDVESRGRFEREAKAAAKFSHPNIVTIYELGNFGGKEKPYIVMEYLEGMDLNSLIGDEGMPFAEALEVAVQLCRALDYAHQKGVVHRDVKPSNLRYLDDGQVKIMDFGIARVEGSHQITKSGVMIGTLHYMSPEQIRGDKLDGRTDIFSSGCILYEMLTGSRPFPGESATSILYNIVNEEPKPVVTKNADLPQEIQDVLDRALAKRPEGRFQTAGEMAKELEKLLAVYRKTLPRTTNALQGRLDEVDALARAGKWAEVAQETRSLLDRYPQLDDLRRLQRRALRALHEDDRERGASAEEKTKHLAEIHQELTELYGDAATRRPGSERTREPFPLGETELSPVTTLAPGPSGSARGGDSAHSAVRALAAPIWALVFVAILGIAGGLYWMTVREPPGPVTVEQRLRVFSNPPGASVLLNGRPTGLVTKAEGAELRLSGVENDAFVIETRLDGFEPATSEVRLRSEPPQPLEFLLVPAVRKLRIASSPEGAEVRLDGEPLEGVTPLEIDLPANGEHEIALSKAEYQSRTVRVEEGEPLPDGPFVLTPLGKPGTVAVASAYPVAIHRGTTVLAGAELAPSVRLRPGDYELRLVAPQVFLDRSVPASVREGETTTLQTPQLGRVNVRANPGNCTLEVDGFAAGSPPLMNREIAEGTHEFVFTWPGGLKDVQRVEVRAGRPTYVIGQRP